MQARIGWTLAALGGYAIVTLGTRHSRTHPRSSRTATDATTAVDMPADYSVDASPGDVVLSRARPGGLRRPPTQEHFMENLAGYMQMGMTPAADAFACGRSSSRD